MARPVAVWRQGRELGLSEQRLPLSPFPSEWPIEIEIGFGKGRYLLSRAAAEPTRGFVGIESAAPYYRLVNRRAARRGLANLVTIRGEAIYLVATVLERRRAEAVHLYFSDPWPKSRHHRRRVLDATTIDLLLSLLRPGGRLYFATDHDDYGRSVTELLRAHPALEVEVLDRPWIEGPRTNYERKYEDEGRVIRRLVATLDSQTTEPALHPRGERAVLV